VNPLGQRTNVANTGSAFASSRSIAWGYDSLGQVTKADSSVSGFDRAYQYDGIGNRKKAANSLTLPTADNYTSNALNQYTAVGTILPTYDDDGNATAYPVPTRLTANSTLAWDAENRMRSASVNGVTTTYLYDSGSRRIAQTTGTTTTVYVYDAWNPVAEYTGNSLKKTYTWGSDLSGSLQGAGGVGGLLAVTDQVAAGKPSYFPTYDGNGNVSEYLTSAGATVAHYEYDPFGRSTSSTGTLASSFAHRFSTKPVDGPTGLYYYGYRYYDPATGRWPSRDPIEEEGGINLYGFVGNDGIHQWDALGLKTCRTRRGVVRLKIDKLPSWFPAKFKGEIGLRHSYEECDDGSSKMTAELYGSARAQGPVRIGAVPLGTKGGKGLQMMFTLIGSGSINLNFCNGRLDGFDVAAKIEVWGGLALDAVVATASAEIGGDFRIYFGSSDADGAVFIRADAAFKARGRYSVGYGFVSYDDSFMFVARSPAFNLLEFRRGSVTVAGFKFD